MIDQRGLRPPAAALSWVARTLGRGHKVVRWRRLTGGITSSVHQLAVVDQRGSSYQVVLKQWTEERAETRVWLEREAVALAAIEGAGLPAPRLLGFSAGAETAGAPAVLMTRVPGRPDLDPREPGRWLEQMASTLVRIHALTANLPALAPPSLPEPRLAPWPGRPEVWEEAELVLTGPWPDERALVHGDYQHFNLLWQRGLLTGVVDWTLAGMGHPDRDLGHCRLNLAVLFSPEWAETFRSCYEAEAGRRLERWWDVYEITRYSDQWPRFIPVQVAGRARVNIEGMNARVDRLLSSALR